MGSSRRKFTKEFKLDAVQRLRAGEPAGLVARGLEVSRQELSFLGTWRPNLLNLVFATGGGKPLDRGNLVARKLHPLLDSLKIRRCGLHAFRHTNGSLMDRLQTPMKVRQERLGHAPGSDITMAVYTHTVSEDDRKIAQQLGEILDPNGPKFSHDETPTIQHAETIQ